MKAFPVCVNGKRTALAGLDGRGVLTTMVHLATSETNELLDLEIGGLDSDSGRQMIWPSPSIDVGDEIAIRVVEVDCIDEPMD